MEGPDGGLHGDPKQSFRSELNSPYFTNTISLMAEARLTAVILFNVLWCSCLLYIYPIQTTYTIQALIMHFAFYESQIEACFGVHYLICSGLPLLSLRRI